MTRTRRFLSNVLWSWSGVVMNFILGLILTPYTIHHLGYVNSGMWALGTSLVAYYWLLDMGFRSATIKMSAQFRATGDEEKLNELLSTGATCVSAAGLVALATTWVAAPAVGRIILKADQPEFVLLLRVVSASWALGWAFTSVLSACLEGFQRFDLTSKIWLGTTLLRSAGVVALLSRGYGLVAMGYLLLGTQLLSYGLTYLGFRRAVPQARLSVRKSRLAMLRAMAIYGIHSFTCSISNLLLTRSIPFMIPRLLGIQNVIYYTTPVAILDYATDGLGRIGMVTAPNATELMAQGEPKALVELGVYTNRYSFALFAPMAVLLMVYGPELLTLWIKRDFAAQCASLLPVLLLGYFVVAGQTNSVSILFGMGRHKAYSRCLFAEAVLMVTGVVIAVPHFGLIGAAWVVAILMAVNRGAVLCWLVSRELKINPFRYAARIYPIPLAIALVAWIALRWVKAHWIPGHSWGQMAAAGAIVGIVYAILAVRFCMPGHHRERAITLAKSVAGSA